MEAFLLYFVKSSGIILLFLLCYKFFLSRETFHTSTRYFLLSGLLFAIVLPFITYTKTVWVEIPSLDVPLKESIVTETPNEVASKIELASILFAVYILGILYGTIRLLVQLLSLSKVFRNSREVGGKKFKVLESNKPLQPFTFFKYIVYHPQGHSEEDIKAILAHENVHSRQYHSIDLLAMHLFSIFQWCNPFIYLYKFYLKENLEFIADANTISASIQKENYQYLLVKNTFGEKHPSFVNPFFNSSIKKRIVMLNKKRSKKSSSIKYALVIPLLVGFALLFNVETIAKIKTSATSAISTDQKVPDPKVYSISKDASDEEIDALKKKIKKENGKLSIKNLKRNPNNEIITISVTYELNEGGYVTGNYDEETNINTIYFGQNEKGGLFISTDETNLSELKKGEMPRIKRQDFSSADVYSIHKNTSDKKLKQIKSTIEKKGGEFSYTLKRNSNGEIIELELEIVSGGTGRFKSEPPFERCYFGSFPNGGIFVADDEKSFNQLKKRNAKADNGLGENIREAKNDKFNEVVYDKEKSGDFPILTTLNYRSSRLPLYLVNGIETPYNALYTLSPSFIESTKVYKGEYAVSIYGEKGKNGVIAIQTKGAIYSKNSGDDLKPYHSVFDYPVNSDAFKTSPLKLSDYLKVPDLTRVGSEESEDSLGQSQWKVSAGLSPKNKNEMSASELYEYSQRQQAENFQQEQEEALIILDGKEISQKKFSKIKASKIESMSVLKGENAEEKYGIKGKNGVIEVKTRNKGIAIERTDRNPLIIINGKEASKEEMQNLDQAKIKSISILKDEQAIKKYGKKAKDGAVEIELKKA